jgi:predicted ATP-grasp superfamily ATP-dependent carboligase
MRIFLYEHLTALGLGRDPDDALHGMYREGRAMRDALAADLAAIPDCSVTFDEAAERDMVIAIAPETDGVLLQLSERFADGWLGCSPEAIALTTDKLALANHWRANGVRTPATTDRDPTPCEAFPVVWKPRDGCGSTATFLLNDAFDLARAIASQPMEHPGPMIVQEFVPGRAVSLAFLCGPGGNVPLIPAFQHLSTDGRFYYHGGELPIPADLAERAVSLGSRAVNCVLGLRGYVGVDMVLGENVDWAIEINPRLTTSYLGLRTLAEFNLAEAMMQVANGSPVISFTWGREPVRFSPEGMERVVLQKSDVDMAAVISEHSPR